MEASEVSRRPPVRVGGPSLASEARAGFIGPVRELLYLLGDLAAFIGRALAAVPGVWRYSSETIRQAGIIIAGSALVIWFMMFIIGTMCATEANYTLRSYGGTVYSGVFAEYCGIREMAPYMWGYIVAAKIGCGLVAEIGSMRINEEIDALETLGLSSMRYIVATRLVGAWLAFPFIYLTGLLGHVFATYLVIVYQIGEVSRGGYEFVYWSFSSPTDVVFSLTKAMVMGTSIVLIGMFFGYRARGGPVGVGTATAQSMIVNLMVLHIIGSVLTMVFWGLTPMAPIGG